MSLKMWIDRRIGGEIATWRKDGRRLVPGWDGWAFFESKGTKNGWFLNKVFEGFF